MRVVVIGAGVMGCAAALELSRRGVGDVVVLERAVPGAEASSAAAGMLAAQVESKSDDERAMFVRARDGYAAWATELRELTGVDVGYKKSGVLELATHGDELARLARVVGESRAAGLRAEMVDVAGALAIERELAASELAGAAWFPDEAQVDPPRLLRALVAAVARAGVAVKSGATVTSILEEGGRCAGVALDGREVLHADAVVLAAGSWSSLVPGVPSALPAVRPVRGQLVMLEERPPRLSTITFLDGAYVVPRGDGRVVCGSTMEDVGHRREVTAAGVSAILAAAMRIAPGLGAAELARVWCNFRPHAEGGPQIGRSPLPGLFLATGHHRNGILLAKLTAEQVAGALLDGGA
ncbi:MAG: FAD-dependent oxidoreductase [Labilithrix sp.]|nr:FAD-dependent oxidoreductase [Labilithrix sp.]